MAASEPSVSQQAEAAAPTQLPLKPDEILELARARRHRVTPRLLQGSEARWDSRLPTGTGALGVGLAVGFAICLGAGLLALVQNTQAEQQRQQRQQQQQLQGSTPSEQPSPSPSAHPSVKPSPAGRPPHPS